MSQRPPLNALNVFCAVVREGGIRSAAEVLHVTPGAVSRQIQSLETYLSQALLQRAAGGAGQLTPAGRRLYKRVAAPVAAIHAAMEDAPARQSRRSAILVDTSVTLAMYWLIPQLRFFAQLHPHWHVEVRTSNGAADLKTPADLYIRRDIGELPGLVPQPFMDEHAIVVASPALQAAHRGPPSRRWLAEAPRIGAHSRPDLWPSWSQQLHPRAAPLEPTLWFDNTVLAIQAALQGLGVLVAPALFVTTMVQGGALRQLGTDAVRTGGYSFALGTRRDSARVAAFVDWLCAAAPGFASPDGPESATGIRGAGSGRSGKRRASPS